MDCEKWQFDHFLNFKMMKNKNLYFLTKSHTTFLKTERFLSFITWYLSSYDTWEADCGLIWKRTLWRSCWYKKSHFLAILRVLNEWKTKRLNFSKKVKMLWLWKRVYFQSIIFWLLLNLETWTLNHQIEENT